MKLLFGFDNNVLKFFRYNDLTHTLNLNKVLAKEHQLVHSWVADEISVLKILFCKH